jgi:hypothetical protein
MFIMTTQKQHIKVYVLFALLFFMCLFTVKTTNAQTPINMLGDWSINANRHNSTIKITDQNGMNFSGTIFTENLVNGRITGNRVTFTRMWSSGNLRQDYTGIVTVNANGTMTMRGTFTQNGRGSYSWTAQKQQGRSVGSSPPPQSSTPNLNLQYEFATEKQATANMRGNWTINANNHRSSMNVTTQNGNDFSGKLFSENLVNGKISGNRVTFTRMWSSGKLRQDYTGTLTVNKDGSMTIRGTFTQNGKGSYNWTASK